MLKLTRTNGNTVYVDPYSITLIEAQTSGTVLMLDSVLKVSVSESPEQILAVYTYLSEAKPENESDGF